MQLLEHFASLTLHPKNAQELKGLILQLAIQGKLTAHWRKKNPDVEPASVLLNRIMKDNEILFKNGKNKKELTVDLISKKEIGFELPSLWKWCRLKNLGKTLTGGTPSKSNQLYFGNDIPFIKPGDIQNGIVNYHNEGLSNLGKDKLGRIAPAGSILMVCLGTIGKCALIDRDCSFNQQINSIHSNQLNSKFLLFALSSKYFHEIAWQNSTSTTIALLNKTNWEKIPIPIAPLEEQKEIVRVVESLFKEVEQLEQLTVERIALKNEYVTSALQQLTTQNAQKEWQDLKPQFKDFFTEKSTIKKLRETVLQLAVQGKLTADWRSCYPELVSGSNHASELLQSIQKEKAQLIKDKKIKKESPLPAITKDEIPYELPEGWVWCRIIDVCTKVTDGFHHTPTKLDNGIIYISATHIKENGILWNDCHFIGEKEHSELFRKASQSKGDVLIVNRGAGCGTPAIVDIDEPFSFQNAALIGFNENYINSHYMNNFILQKRTEIMDIFTNGGAQPMLSNKILKTLLFPFAPIEEQKAIVEKVNALMGLCDALEQEVAESKAFSEQLMQSVLREVFEGERV